MNSTTRLNQKLLEEAWNHYRVYDCSAAAAQKRFLLLRRSILIVTVAVTLFATLELQFSPTATNPKALSETNTWWEWFLHFLVVTSPIVLTILLTGAVKFDRGMHWVFLRSAAESVKREIYLYRSRVEKYTDPKTRDASFALEMQTLEERLMKTAVNRSGLAYEIKKLKNRQKGSKVLLKSAFIQN